MSDTMDLSFLSEEERQQIMNVLQRDDELKRQEDKRARKLKHELQELRKKGAIKSGSGDAGKTCARCREPLGLVFNSGELCPKCQHKVCKNCKVLQKSGKRPWLCIVCNKQQEIKARTGEWFFDKGPQPNNAKLLGSDLVRASIRYNPTSRDSPGRGRRPPDGVRRSPHRHSPQRLPPQRHKRQSSGETVTDAGSTMSKGSPSRAAQFAAKSNHIPKEDYSDSSSVDTSGPYDNNSSNRDKRHPPVPLEDPSPESHRPYEHYRVHELKRRSSTDSETSSPQVSTRTSPHNYNNDGMDTPTTLSSAPTSELEDRERVGHVASDLSDSEPEAVTEAMTGIAFHRMSMKSGGRRSPLPGRHELEAVEENVDAQPSNKPNSGNEPSTDSGVESQNSRHHNGDTIVGSPSSKPPPSPSLSTKTISTINTVASTETTASTVAVSMVNAPLLNDNFHESDKPPSTTPSIVSHRSPEHQRSGGSTPTLQVKTTAGKWKRQLTLLEIAQGKSSRGQKESNGSVPAIEVIESVPVEDEREDIDKHFKPHSSNSATSSPARMSHLSSNTLSSVLKRGKVKNTRVHGTHKTIPVEHLYRIRAPLIYGSVDSLTSFYSSAGERNLGKITVTGDIKFDMNYNYKTGIFEVKIIACRDLAPVDTRKNFSDPYVKTYLLPDKTKNGKRKTKVKKHTLNPHYDDTLKYTISESELQTRTLWISVWHNDAFGHNDFLGEIQLPLDDVNFEEFTPDWRSLVPRVAGTENTLLYKGDLSLALKYVVPDAANGSPSRKPTGKGKKKKDPPGQGVLHVHIREAKNLIAVRINGYSDPFAKCYLLPNKSKSGKRKTDVLRKNCNPKWDEKFVYEGLTTDDLKERALEITLWDRESMTSNDFLGGLRLGIGNGKSYGKDTKWQDSRPEEMAVWHKMLDSPNQWVETNLMLRSHMNGKEAKEPEFI
ncbi:synaptotagmin-like protein 5 isoform X2 [Glandiceps talaboti]